ncbi:phospholipase-like protein [Tanacetum coccineum]
MPCSYDHRRMWDRREIVIVSLVVKWLDSFHFPGVTHDAVMLRVFPITLKGPTLRWINRLSARLVTTWDLLEKAFIRKYCPPFKTTKKLEIIRNFKQEMDETLYYAWERTCETICAIGIPEEIKENDGDMNDGCDIMGEDVERLRKCSLSINAFITISATIYAIKD